MWLTMLNHQVLFGKSGKFIYKPANSAIYLGHSKHSALATKMSIWTNTSTVTALALSTITISIITKKNMHTVAHIINDFRSVLPLSDHKQLLLRNQAALATFQSLFLFPHFSCLSSLSSFHASRASKFKQTNAGNSKLDPVVVILLYLRFNLFTLFWELLSYCILRLL